MHDTVGSPQAVLGEVHRDKFESKTATYSSSRQQRTATHHDEMHTDEIVQRGYVTGRARQQKSHVVLENGTVLSAVVSCVTNTQAPSALCVCRLTEMWIIEKSTRV